MVVRHLGLGFESGRRGVGRISSSLGHFQKTFGVDDVRLDGIEVGGHSRRDSAEVVLDNALVGHAQWSTVRPYCQS